jgi:copper chaperone CopZ
MMGSPTTRATETKGRAMLKLKVPEMTCGHCAATIEKAVKGLDPAAKVQVDLGTKTVTVETASDETSVKEVIEAAGYDNEKIAA